jgi:ABC-type glycerol-3-phosphate transport system permease component
MTSFGYRAPCASMALKTSFLPLLALMAPYFSWIKKEKKKIYSFKVYFLGKLWAFVLTGPCSFIWPYNVWLLGQFVMEFLNHLLDKEI